MSNFPDSENNWTIPVRQNSKLWVAKYFFEELPVNNDPYLLISMLLIYLKINKYTEDYIS